MIRTDHGAFVAAMLALAVPGAALGMTGMMESWYMNRGKSNLKIGNHKAAIEAFEKVVEANPENLEARRDLGIALEKQGLRDKAIEQFDQYLEKNPDDAEIAFKQAENLGWSRYSYRKQDALKYYRMGLRKKNDPRMRLRYARLLAANKSTTSDAIEQYRVVLASDPDNRDAHMGLARAYAWNGQNDKALYHANRAGRSTANAELASLRKDLNKGREPMVGTEIRFLTQPSSTYSMDGVSAIARGRYDLSPFVTANLQAGFENYRDQGLEASGGLFELGAQYRIDEKQRLDASAGFHGLTAAESTASGTGNRRVQNAASTGAAGFVFKAQYSSESPEFSVRPGFKREIRDDSLAAVAGMGGAGGQPVGAARSNQFYVDLEKRAGAFDLGLRPFAGFVTASGVSPNPEIGTEFKASAPLVTNSDFSLRAGYLATLSHYGTDRSGISEGGYFSPRLFLSQSPRLQFRVALSDSSAIDFGGGPAIQYVDDSGNGSPWRFGGDVRASFDTHISNRVVLQLASGYSRVADTYNRLEILGGASYLF